MAAVTLRLPPLAGLAPALALILIVLLLSHTPTAAQNDTTPSISNLHHALIPITPLPQRISSLPVLPNTIQLKGNAEDIAFQLDSTLTRIAFSAPRHRYGDTLALTFRTIDLPLHSSFLAKELLEILSPDSALSPLTDEKKHLPPAMPTPPIIIEGIAERSLGVGNQSYASPSAGIINLSIRGPLYHTARFEARIIDNFIPFQPDGTSARIKNIDKIFLRVFDSSWRVEAGDILIEECKGKFLRQREETQGLGGAWQNRIGTWDSVAFNATIGTAKGEIERTDIAPIEGVQGPYPLMGTRNFTQVVVRADSERVFIDGELLTRGEKNDYTIDYNLGTVTFTAKRPINSHMRIVVEYETTKRNFTKILGNISMAARNANGWQFDVKGYIAHDCASSLPAELNSPDVVRTLSKLSPAQRSASIVLNAEKVNGMTHDGYTAVDTLANNTHFSIYRYHPAGYPDSLLALPFAYVGPNQGDYQLTQGANNSSVYRWVAPVNGIPQGDYAPGIRIAPPSSKAMIESTVTKHWQSTPASVSLSTAYSYHNGNTISNASKQQSYAIEMTQNARIAKYSNGGLYVQSRGRWIANDFFPVNRYLPLEFNREWGEAAVSEHKPWADAMVALSSRTAQTFALLKGEMLWRPNALAWRGSTSINIAMGKWRYEITASALTRNSDSTQSSRGSIFTSLGRSFTYIRVVADAHSEWLIPVGSCPSRSIAPYAFAEGGLTVALTDTATAKASLRTSYRRGWDSTQHAELRPRLDAVESTLDATIQLGDFSSIGGNMAARATLPISTYWGEKRQFTLLASLFYTQALLQRRLDLNARLSLSSEMLPKWQFHFIPVPIGQGTHVWIDANSDGTPQLDEFLPAQHADEALFIRQVVASSEQQRAYVCETTLAFSFTPRANGTPIVSSTPLWQRFDLALTLEHAAKRTDKRIGQLFNPIAPSTDTLLPERHRAMLLSVTLNQHAAPLSVAYSLTLTDNRQTVAQGILSGATIRHLLTLQTPIRPGLGGKLAGENTLQTQQRPYSNQPTESLLLWQSEGTIAWRSEKAQTHELNAILNWITLQPKQLKVKSQRYAYQMVTPLSEKWKASLLLGYCLVRGDAIGHHALAYQALAGNTNGNNFNIKATLTYKITTFLELNCTYALRKHGKSPLVHSGFATLRAIF